jgi:hypothetical protein
MPTSCCATGAWTGCARESAAAPWWPGVEPVAFAVVLTGAFGIALGDPDQPAPQVAPSVVVRHAVLVLAHLVPDRRRLRALVDLAWVEIARADHQD